ncbi:hypothetical protein GGP41_001948 [Bipolaris sorokiniana]|uniref:Cyclase n=2 Tax=Cochliobolus sativus TaxID=45130 RepID=A0A8H5ZT72_COCSA|nr:uncharacterized protein COCSADRAFT_38454 [Bipolaris sorokiniana ND90Pr]EMD62542.1 hypothetical protein COCSADRAFT_38454 [Bipolaris sorokiniana ND90Pr]KAF5853423.1 hypothetical protein GGP41_001948 [Bipolaris sorokiniana]
MRLDPNGDGATFPKRSALPHVSGTPKGNAWFWGSADELGRLNLLTPERTLATVQENVKTGDSISLDLPLNVPGPALFGRQGLKHRIRSAVKGAYDDEVSYNTQSSTQWDGFRHFAHPTYGCHYNGVLSDDIMTNVNDDGEDGEEAPEQSRKLGIDAWAKKGIIGRGVLLDIWSWSQKQGKEYDPFTRYAITAEDLKACAESQGTGLRTADILLVRTGWQERYNAFSAAEKSDLAALALDKHFYAGLASDEEMKDFLYDGYFAAAATDCVGFEVWPPASWEGSLHANMLPLWGMPIGELWNLEELKSRCEKEGRWNFLLVSKPADIPGGVACVPNAVAIF